MEDLVHSITLYDRNATARCNEGRSLVLVIPALSRLPEEHVMCALLVVIFQCHGRWPLSSSARVTVEIVAWDTRCLMRPETQGYVTQSEAVTIAEWYKS